ncbi:hypothetical protein RchiOBHm_Chr1g0316971 [Rosa chinensis]|uniref:Uncharacterized protein n=1 Tax=Rosa chinensis TaxID=74649 RepID=A0A2P6S7R8_ROSCH|nr:hypothetical protein RchiOBHm_Chr1g0316971 [Rosa chinensis]
MVGIIHSLRPDGRSSELVILSRCTRMSTFLLICFCFHQAMRMAFAMWKL